MDNEVIDIVHADYSSDHEYRHECVCTEHLRSTAQERGRVLVLDEPTAGLDPRGRRELLELIDRYHKQEKNTVLFVSHSMDDVAEYSDMVLVMNQSRVFCYDTVKNVFSRSFELNDMGLNIPSVTQILVMLKKNGFDMDTTIYNLDDAVRMVKERYDEGVLL